MAEQQTDKGWGITCRRIPTDWELSRVTSFYNLLETWANLKEGFNSGEMVIVVD
uniref:Uncharacterized protein n=1 Tax=Solanum tuberosum TaxID=4113 RepID=M1CPT4_SOLTU